MGEQVGDSVEWVEPAAREKEGGTEGKFGVSLGGGTRRKRDLPSGGDCVLGHLKCARGVLLDCGGHLVEREDYG